MDDFRRIAVSHGGAGDNPVAVVEFRESRLSGADLMPELAEELNALLDRLDRKDVVLDMGRIEFVASAALNRLINFQKRVRTAGGQLKLCNLRPEIETVFIGTRLNQVFDIHKTKEDAIASCV